MILFAAIVPPPKVTRDVKRLMRGLPGARWHDEGKLHITVGYFGEVADPVAEELDEELARTPLPAFELTLKGADHFGRAEPHAVHLTIDDAPGLTRLHQHCRRCARHLGIPMEKRVFTPHLTLAYLRGGIDPDRLIAFEQRHARSEIGPFLVDQFSLFSSWRQKRGPNRYDLEATYPLLGKEARH